MTTRLLIVALDGADGKLLDRWSLDGTLPNLQALRLRGSAKRLNAPGGITDDGLWASFKFAAGLGEHGRYHWRQHLESGKVGMAYLRDPETDAFWQTLSNHGNRVAVFDIPKCGDPNPINGIHLVDWLAHGRYFQNPKSSPEPLAAEVTSRFGPTPPSQCGYEQQVLTDTEIAALETNWRASIKQKKAAGLHFLLDDQWDLFAIAFKEAHCAGHSLWEIASSADPGADSSGDQNTARALKTIYKDLDSAVGELIKAAGPETSVITFCPSDMEANATLAHLMPELVDRLNRHLGNGRLARKARRVWRRLTSINPRRPCELLPYNENCTALRVSPDWKIGHQLTGSRGNKGRMLDEIESVFQSLVDAETGQAIVSTIDRPSTEQAGRHREELPDLLIQYAAGTFPRAIKSSTLGRIEAERPSIRPGNHAPGGLAIVSSGIDAPDTLALQDIGRLAIQALGEEPVSKAG